MTLREALSAGRAVLEAGGAPDTAWLDATLLWAGLCGLSRTRVLAELSAPGDVPANQVEAFLARCAQRAAGTPVAYLNGVKEFFGRDFRVDPRVLVPRPETEVLVEWVLETATPAGCPASPLRLLDLCTGSGCVPITIGMEFQARGMPSVCLGADLSSEALETAKTNAATLWPDGPISWCQGDLFAALPQDEPPFDLITANPPYVPAAEAATGAQTWGEPLMALDGGHDGLDLIRRLAVEARRWLKPGGWLFVEFGDGQWPSVLAILEAEGWRDASCRCDLAGLPRTVRASL